ncbi:MAG: hypothetical protein KF681_16395 [Bdellovibrionaceae bacterium]|nr:hypothetical protein [Pseudobdellovibrionaceae bacterium]
MAAKKETQTDIKKVQPYPFGIDIVLAEGAPPVRGFVHKLTDVGFLMRTANEHHFKVGDNHQARFELPVVHLLFDEPVKVIKTYDAVEDVKNKELKKNFTIELHFRSLPPKKREDILKFLALIGQK